ncbi:MAG: OprO/OprP family phosphate-selective porin [Spirochaetia bacterium]|nr:OprO/OprP family phosphate-selective porin [Spirochaetia bacterium]
MNKNRIYRYFIFIFFLFCNYSFAIENTEVEVLNDEEVSKNSNFKKDIFNFKGFIQTQLYLENSGKGNIYTETHEDGLRIRRGRLSAFGQIVESTSYLFQINANENHINLEDALIRYQLTNILSIDAGRFKIPFGIELYEKSEDMLFAERSRYWSYLFHETKSSGFNFNLTTDYFLWQSGIFYNYTDGYSSVRKQEITNRLLTKISGFYSGLSFYTNFAQIEGKALDSDIKYNLFFGYQKNNVKIKAEATTWYLNLNKHKKMAYGSAMSFHYMFFDKWIFSNRFSYLFLEKPEKAIGREIGQYNMAKGLPAKKSIDLTLSMSYFFFSQSFSVNKKESQNQSKISIDYNPSYHDSTTLSHAFYLQFQVCFN